MELIAVIAIILSLSGATYAGIVAIKSIQEERIKEILDDAESKSEQIKEIGTISKNIELFKSAYNGIKHANRIRKLSFYLPIWIFGLVSFFIAVIFVMKKQPIEDILPHWFKCRLLIGSIVFIDVLCLSASFIMYWWARHYSRKLKDHLDIAKENAKKNKLKVKSNEEKSPKGKTKKDKPPKGKTKKEKQPEGKTAEEDSSEE